MKRTPLLQDLIASSARRRAELEQRIESLSFELRDELEELTGREFCVQTEKAGRFILIVERMRPSNTGASA